jgi:hypothetical protein
MEWIQTVPREGFRQFRHMLRYFAFPDLVERMSSNNDRRRILAGFGIAPQGETKKWSDRELDQALLNLRKKLEEASPSETIDFYAPSLKKRWSFDRKVKTIDGEVTVTASRVDEEEEENSDGSFNQRPGVEQRLRNTLELLIPDLAIRRAALDFLASAIDIADEERSDAWCLGETGQGLRLMTGRLLACEIVRSKMRVSVIGPVSADTRAVLEVDAEKDAEFKMIPGWVMLTFPVERAAQASNVLGDSLNTFINAAMARVRRRVSLEEHDPEAVAWVAGVLGRELPQPHPFALSDTSEQFDDLSDDEDLGLSREPRVRGRAPIFELGQRSIASLMNDVEREVIALPDLQRPFVWEDTKVRDLLDSLFVGFPVGTLVFWPTADDREARALGAERPSLRATTLVIDGQQRLTSLYAVTHGVDVIDKDDAPRKIKIAFRPRDGRFEVADAAIRNGSRVPS